MTKCHETTFSSTEVNPVMSLPISNVYLWNTLISQLRLSCLHHIYCRDTKTSYRRVIDEPDEDVDAPHPQVWKSQCNMYIAMINKHSCNMQVLGAS